MIHFGNEMLTPAVSTVILRSVPAVVPVVSPMPANAVLASVTRARENARSVREQISSEMWEQLNGLYLRLREAQAESTRAARPHYLSRMVVDGIHLFGGETDETMAHGEGWQYLQLGRYLERAGVTAARPAARRWAWPP